MTISGGFELLRLGFERPGNFRFKEFGETNEEVSMKNINNKNMISVNEDMLNSALTLFRFFNPIIPEVVWL